MQSKASPVYTGSIAIAFFASLGEILLLQVAISFVFSSSATAIQSKNVRHTRVVIQLQISQKSFNCFLLVLQAKEFSDSSACHSGLSVLHCWLSGGPERRG